MSILSYSIPILPLPLHLGHLFMPNLSARVAGAFGLARKGSSLGTLLVPLQSGHIANIAIPNTTFCAFSSIIIVTSSSIFYKTCPELTPRIVNVRLHLPLKVRLFIVGKQVMVVKRVGILYHPLIEGAYTLAKELQDFLGSSNVSAWLCSAWEGEKAKAQVNDIDLILSIGGDGTILRAAQIVVPTPIPITGINLGKLGFMTELSADEARDKLPAILAGEGWIDERSLLEAELSSAEREQDAAHKFYALNDVVVARGAIARVISIEARIDGELLTTYKADGVIVATATGSTGYSLAAGGPILHRQAKELLLLPILPHLSPAYTLVLPSTAIVKLGINTTHEATLSIDGHMNLPISSGITITIKRSSNTACFLRIHPATSFYSSLEQKLKGKR